MIAGFLHLKQYFPSQRTQTSKRYPLIVSLAFLSVTSNALAVPGSPDGDDVYVKVIDTGPGLATVTRLPGGYYMVYDAGHWTEDASTIGAIREVIPDGETIDLLILSHSDSDHLGAVDEIFEHYPVERVLRGGLERQTETWKVADIAINTADVSGETIVVNLKRAEFPIGATYRFGDAYITFVMGHYAPPDKWGFGSDPEDGEFRNAGSIVVRLFYRDRSILFTGDAVGRHIGDPQDAIIATELAMLENAAVIPIEADVLIAPHHGADNGSSAPFIQAVNPEFVVLPAGHDHIHPATSTVQRYLAAGVALENIFRTDLGDDESDDEKPDADDSRREWTHGRIAGHQDPRGDDGVEIILTGDSEVTVRYVGNESH